MKIGIVFALIAAVLLTVCNIVMGPLNQDEGWYLLAGLNTASGMAPYRDYMYTQGPLMPYIYALFSPLWMNFGVLGGRILTSVFGLAAALLFAGFSYRVAPYGGRRLAFFTALILTSCSPVYSYFTAIPKTYALAGLFIGASFFVIAGNGRFKYELCGIFLALAAGVRIPMGLLLPVMGLWLLVGYKKECCKTGWLRFGIAGGIALTLIFVVSIMPYADNFLFAQSYHASREKWDIVNWVILRVGFVSRIIQGYPMIPVVCIIATLGAILYPMAINSLPRGFMVAAVGFVVVALAHFMSPFPYDDYITPIIPLAASACAVWLGTVFRKNESIMADKRSALVWALLVCTGLFLVSSPLCTNWGLVRQDRFWFQFKDEPDIIKLMKVGNLVKENTSPDDVLLTQDLYVAVQAQRKVLKGLEMGPFSVFDYEDDDTVKKRNVHNVATLKESITTGDAKIAVVSGYTFAISCPSTAKMDSNHSSQLFDALNERYETFAEIKDFGQGYTDVQVMRKK